MWVNIYSDSLCTLREADKVNYLTLWSFISPPEQLLRQERRFLVYFYVLLLAANQYYEWDCVGSGARSVSDKRPNTHAVSL